METKPETKTKFLIETWDPELGLWRHWGAVTCEYTYTEKVVRRRRFLFWTWDERMRVIADKRDIEMTARREAIRQAKECHREAIHRRFVSYGGAMPHTKLVLVSLFPPNRRYSHSSRTIWKDGEFLAKP